MKALTRYIPHIHTATPAYSNRPSFVIVSLFSAFFSLSYPLSVFRTLQPVQRPEPVPRANTQYPVYLGANPKQRIRHQHGTLADSLPGTVMIIETRPPGHL